MRILGIAGIIGLLGGMRGAIPVHPESDVSSQSGGERTEGRAYSNIKSSAKRVSRIMKYVCGPEVADFIRECSEREAGGEVEEMCQRLGLEYLELGRKIAEFGEAAGNSACSFEVRKRLAIEVVERSLKVNELLMRIDMEFGFCEEDLKSIDEVCKHCRNQVGRELRFRSYDDKVRNLDVICY
ncbi:hypothetical protein [Encephalitozoon cuniculi GB-M1]|uniref:Uncharacterized protein n=2 Tax=Encephalitozoon cuniculi (strain GB-M1) TaxID=284813 RepID=Q8ST68_ENCCU|nr:uncharacterized protein ECU11_0150 [Encephalitozoon cuniculi GB-M1]CAD25925.3 hypothetical protein [Encephalitozoon cuniculi GB-M1]